MAMQFRMKFSTSTVLFASIVVFPTLLAILYFGLFASDVYVSESRIVVRAPDKTAQTAFGALLKTAGFTNASEEVHAVTEYIQSRDALRDVDRNGLVRRAYSNSTISIFDRLDPLGLDDSFEELYKYFGHQIEIKNDTTSGVLTLTVRAYSARDAKEINEGLLSHSEALINRLNVRGGNDLIGSARREVYEATEVARRAAAKLAAFRNRTGIVDPVKQAQVQIEMVSKMQDELIASQLQLAQVRRLAPNNAQVPLFEAHITQLQQSIDQEQGKVAGNRSSLAANAAQYQRLEIDNEISAKLLTGAMTSLQEAQNEARRKQAYVERIAQPNRPDKPIEPHRLAGIVAVLVLSVVTWGILSMLIAGVREHAS